MYENRELFPNAPLEFVAGEIKFPFAPQLGKDEAFESLGAALRHGFPILERENRSSGLAISPEGMKPVDAHVLWRFLNRKRTASISVTSTSLTVETTDYGEYEQFRASLSQGLQAVAALKAVVGIERIGLRYIDELRIPHHVDGPADWGGYVNDALLHPLRTVEGFDSKALEGVIQLSVGPQRGLTVRYASLQGPGVVGRGPLKRRSQSVTGPFFALDIDSYWSGADEAVPEFNPEQVLETFDALHEPVGVLFLRMITEQFKVEVARKEHSGDS
ncbi:TIGR04255 family protein [Ferrimicrobium sp.]|uniref:TIGR04255 family protein n=1 Tax=Ferrimicrobium sp. TaxID=2926050 RepID=UPI0026348F7D|nr:TIGR04255 family protein [Ferrimicrobium sp.]